MVCNGVVLKYNLTIKLQCHTKVNSQPTHFWKKVVAHFPANLIMLVCLSSSKTKHKTVENTTLKDTILHFCQLSISVMTGFFK